MSLKFECGDNAALVTYLYDESEPEERSAIEAHLRLCPACAAEFAALSSTSRVLASWTPPDLDMDFRVVAEPRAATVLRPAPWWQRPLPGWAQAAAAVVVFGVGMTLGIARGTSQPAAGPVASGTAASASSAPGAPSGERQGGAAPMASRAELVALEQRLRTELQQALARPEPRATVAPGSAVAEAQLLARVRTLIEESEQRQRRELALRTAAVVRDIDAQRQFDMTRIQRAFGQFEGSAGAEIQRQRQDLNNLIRVSQSPR